MPTTPYTTFALSTNATTGRVAVLFDGAPVLGCQNDTSCAGPLACAVDEPWAAFARMCTCQLPMSYVGPQCATPTPVTSALLVW